MIGDFFFLLISTFSKLPVSMKTTKNYVQHKFSLKLQISNLTFQEFDD